MPLSPIRELLHFTSPFDFRVEGEGDGEALESAVIKGFASIHSMDRTTDIVDPNEFNLDTFMAAPTLLLNHKFWNDPYGNQVPAGAVTSANAAVIKKHKDKTLWSIVDMKTKKEINTYPKASVPDLGAGTEGLFITAEIEIPEIISMIAKRELGGLSWQGMVVVNIEIGPNGRSRRRFSNIDLYEISVVSKPNHNQSTFVVGKNVDGEFQETGEMGIQDVQLLNVQLPKSSFPTEDVAKAYLKEHDLSSTLTGQDKSSYYANQQPADDFDVEKTVRIQMGKSFMWMAPPLVEEDVQQSKVLLEEEPSTISRLVAEVIGVAKSLGDPSMAKEATGSATTPEEEVKEEVEKKVPPQFEKDGGEEKGKEKDGKGKEKEEVAKSADQLSQLGTALGTQVAAQLAPTFEALNTNMTSMGTALTAIVEKMTPAEEVKPAGEETEPNTDTKLNVEKSAPALGDLVGNIAQGLANQQAASESLAGQLLEIAKSVDAMGSSIATPEATRDEVVEQKESVEKSVSDDPNDCMGSLFTFVDPPQG